MASDRPTGAGEALETALRIQSDPTNRFIECPCGTGFLSGAAKRDAAGRILCIACGRPFAPQSMLDAALALMAQAGTVEIDGKRYARMPLVAALALAWRPTMPTDHHDDAEDETRASIEASWRAAKQRSDEVGYWVGNAASVAGQYLELGGGLPGAALLLLPPDAHGPFWQRVRDILSRI